MLEKLLKKIRTPIFALGAYALSMSGCGGCGDTPSGSGSMSADAGREDAQADASSAYCLDSDGDGFYNIPGCGTDVDCDDNDRRAFPGAIEFCDYEDNNCDGNIDEGAGRTVYFDADKDGFGDKNVTAVSCLDRLDDPKNPLMGYVYNPDDCDDSNPDIHPEALELCDKIDYDCDGNPRNGYSVGEPCTNEMPGICSLPGEYICSEDALTVACDAPLGIPEDEICDGLDNDCNGLVDDSLTATSRDCERGVGECERTGLEYRVCLGERGWSREYFDCDAVPADPVAELCDELDNDCDGNPYNGYPVGEPCLNEMPGICSLPGNYICSDDALTVACDAPLGIPEDEVCDGLDNDCNWLVDDSLTATSRDCERGIGECERTGLEYRVCLGERGWSREYFDCDAVPADPVPELCDELDNDCDGNPYNGYPVGEPCLNEMPGICSLSGEYICSDDALTVACDAPLGIPEDEICEGLDNDCNGLVDDSLTAPSRDCERGIGACERSGLEYQVCLGERGWSREYFDCDAIPADPIAELCDELDNDCDGEADNYTRLTDCPGPIRREYTQRCLDGEWSDIDIEDCPECLEGTRRDTACCGYDGEGILSEICVDEHWVDSGECSIDNFINASDHPGRDNEPSIDINDVVFTSDRNVRTRIFFTDTSGIGGRIIEPISNNLPRPSFGCDESGCEWTYHYSNSASLSERVVAFEGTWVEADFWTSDDHFRNRLYVLEVDTSTYNSNGMITGNTPAIDSGVVVVQHPASSTIRAYSSSTMDLVQDFGEGDPYPDVNGDYVVFTSRRGGGGISGVYLGDIVSGEVREEPISGNVLGNDGYRPTIHGNDVVLVSERDSATRQLYHYDIAASELERLTNCGPNYEPSIHNRRVAFTSDKTGNSEIHVCDLNEVGRAPRDYCCDAAVNISNSPLSIDNDPSISGCKVAYVSDRDGNEEIYVHDLCEGGCREE